MTTRTSEPEGRLTAGDWLEDYRTLTQEAGLVPRKPRTQIEILGPDRASFLNRLCTNRIEALAPGSGCEAFLTNSKGRIVGHVLVFAGNESLVLSSAPGQAERILSHLDYYLVRDRVELQDRSAAWSELLVAGRKGETLLGSLLGIAVPQAYLAHAETRLFGAKTSVRRLHGPEPPVFSVSAPKESAADVTRHLCDAGARLCRQEAAEAIRIEIGWPEYGRDIGEDRFPQEVARDALAISFAKGCYLGQETVARIDSRGHVNRFLVKLRFPTADVPADGTVVRAEGQEVGRVTSAAFSPRWGVAAALGYVARGHEVPGSRLESEFGPVEVV